LRDASGALASRFVVFVLTRSFYGREDPTLTEALLLEAPSIFNWALAGLDGSPRAGSSSLRNPVATRSNNSRICHRRSPHSFAIGVSKDRSTHRGG
jgi:phage/plasmid-associated DNA primase